MMKSRLLIFIFATLAIASRRLREREICIVKPLNDPLADDAPAITRALKKCGDTGQILLPVNQTFRLRSPIDLSPCRACDFQINGLLSIAPDWNLWEKQTAAIKIPNTTAAVIHSEGYTGVIDANNFGSGGDNKVSDRIPSLFSISNESYQIHIRNIKIKNVAGTAFYVNSNSSAVRFYGIEFLGPAATGYLVEQSQHVYLWNNSVRATKSCVSILPNSSNIQVEESTCITSGGNSAQSGLELRFQGGIGLHWIRNVFVKNIKAIGSMNVVTFLTGSSGGEAHPVQIKNATFTDITIEGPAKQAVYLEESQNALTATEVSFKEFRGTVRRDSNLKCSAAADICEFKTEGWNVLVQS